MAHPAVDLARRAAAAVPARRVAVWSDDPAVAGPWVAALDDEGLATTLRALDDRAGVEADAFVLHLAGPLAESLTRLRALRQQSASTPLVVAARALRDLDQVLALEMGADDAIDSALAAPVVAARLRALWRRGSLEAGSAARHEMRYGALRLSLLERAAHLGEQRVPLTEGEFEVLWLLASHAGQALSRREILRRVRGLDDHPTDRSIDSRVYRIRAKLGDDVQALPRIRTVRNHGYAFSPVGW